MSTMAEPGVLVEITYSTDELAVLADLLDAPSLPGAPPFDEVGPAARAAAARGLVARGVLRVLPEDAVEVLQPHATMLTLALQSDDARGGLSVHPMGALCTYRLADPGPG